MRNIRKIRSLLCFGAALFTTLTAGQAHAERKLVDRVVAVIDNEIITWRELESKATPFLASTQEIKDPQARKKKQDEVYHQVLDIEIGDRIVEREIRDNRDTLGVSDKDVDRAIEEVIQMNHLTREQLQSALYAQGLTWSEYRKKLWTQIERARLIQYRVQGKVQVKDNDIKRRCLERQRTGARDVSVCASHILFNLPAGISEKDASEVLARASRVQAELTAGADFAAYALQYSDDKGAPDGRLGCFGKGEMVEQFEKAAFALPIGGISQVVRTEFGLHIIRVDDHRAVATAQCDDAKDLEPFRNEVYQEEMQRHMQLWIEELRKKAFVDVRL